MRPGVEDSQVIHLTLWHGVNPPPNRDVLQKTVLQFEIHGDLAF